MWEETECQIILGLTKKGRIRLFASWPRIEGGTSRIWSDSDTYYDEHLYWSLSDPVETWRKYWSKNWEAKHSEGSCRGKCRLLLESAEKSIHFNEPHGVGRYAGQHASATVKADLGSQLPVTGRESRTSEYKFASSVIANVNVTPSFHGRISKNTEIFCQSKRTETHRCRICLLPRQRDHVLVCTYSYLLHWKTMGELYKSAGIRMRTAQVVQTIEATTNTETIGKSFCLSHSSILNSSFIWSLNTTRAVNSV
jgi:hypothetical protein